MAIEHLERLDQEVMRVLEALGVSQDLPVRELHGGLALARRGRRQPGEDALGIGLRAAGKQPEAVELLREVVEQEARARTLGRSRLVLSAPARHARSSRSASARPDAIASAAGASRLVADPT